MEYNYTTSQAPDKGVQVGPEPILTPNATLAMTYTNIPGFGGNFIEVGIVTNGSNRAVYASRAYPANANGKQRPGAVVEYSSEFSVGEGIGGPTSSASDLPNGYFEVEFLESTGSQYIIIPFSASSDGHAIILETVHFTTGSAQVQGEGANFMGYGVYNNARFYAQTGNGFASGGYVANEWNTHKTKWEDNIVTIFKPDGSLASAERGLTTVTTLYLWRMYGINSKWSGKKKCWKASVDGVVHYDMVCSLDSDGNPCMFDKVTRQPFYNNGTGQFIVGMTLAQARKLSKLPAGGGELTVSLPWEAGVDAQVQEALAKAAENGWTVVVQYREPEVATENIAVDFLETTGTQIIVDENISVDENSSWKLKTVKTSNKSITSVLDATAGGNNRFSIIAYNGVWRFDYAALMQKTKSIALGQIYELELTEDLRCLVNGEEVHKFERTDFWSGSRFALFDFKEKTAGYVGRIFYVDVLGANTQRAFVPTIDKNGVPCMHDSVSGQNFYNSGSGAFITGFESTEKAALGLAKLPVVTEGELTVSLPAAAQDEATRVPAAIEVARQRGWTIITQYRED